MNIKNNTFQHLLLVAGVLFFFACKDAEQNEPVKTESPVVVKSPFPFYKNIEVKPGLNFEIISWGKGTDSIGGYQVLMSDSVKNNFRSLAAERKGILTDVWNMDLDNDGNPELYFQLLSKKNVFDLNVYEFSGGNFNKISFPSLNPSQKKGYNGNDKFFIKNGDLFRSFPVKDPADTSKVLVKTYQYKLSGKSFSVQEVKPV